jgi:hypothetical protein
MGVALSTGQTATLGSPERPSSGTLPGCRVTGCRCARSPRCGRAPGGGRRWW